jgi:GNAT superfamily N-acetyltransferase
MNAHSSLSAHFKIVQLLVCQTDAAKHLLDTLPEHKRKFVGSKGRAELLQHIADDYVIGVIDQRDQRLVAMSMLRSDAHEVLFDGLTHWNVERDIPHEQPTGVITTVVVEDGAEGQGIMKGMIEHLLKHAHQNGYKSVSARVVEGNEAPLKRFKKSNFEVFGRGFKAADGLARTFVIKELSPALPTKGPASPISVSDYIT